MKKLINLYYKTINRCIDVKDSRDPNLYFRCIHHLVMKYNTPGFFSETYSKFSTQLQNDNKPNDYRPNNIIRTNYNIVFNKYNWY